MKKKLSRTVLVLVAVIIAVTTSVYADAIGVATHRNYGFDTNVLSDRIKEVEGSWIRQDLPWAEIESGGKLAVPQYLKEFTGEVKSKGVNVLGILGYGNSAEAYRADVMTIPTKDNENYFTAWCNYVRFTVSELRETVDAYEVWNEPDTLRFNTKGATPKQYAELVVETYKIIKELDPTAVVLAGAFLGSNYGSNTTEKFEDGREYVYQFMKTANEYKAQSGVLPFDALSVHIYPQIKEKEIEEEAGGSMDWYIQPLEQLNYDGDIWVSEWGYYTGNAEFALSEEEQASAIIRTAVAFDGWRKENGIDGESIYYEIVDSGTDENDSEHNYGLYKNNMTQAKQSSNALKTFNKLIADKEISSYNDSAYTGFFKTGFLAEYSNGFGKVYVAWDLNNSSSTSMTISGLDKYSDVKLYDIHGNSTPITTSNYGLSVGAEPKFIACQNEGVSIINAIIDNEAKKIRMFGKAYMLNEVEVEICDETGNTLESKTVSADADGYFTAEFNVYKNGEYTLFAGKNKVNAYGEYELLINSSKTVITDVVTASEGLNVTVTATLANSAGNENVTVLVLPENVEPENAEFSDYAYLGQKYIEGNDISISFGLREGTKGKYKVYISSSNVLAGVNNTFFANMVEVSSFTIEPDGVGKVVAKAVVDTHGVNVDEAVIIIAQYNSHGVLIQSDVSEAGVSGSVKTLTADIVSDAVEMKAFLWDGTDNIKPLALPAHLTK